MFSFGNMGRSNYMVTKYKKINEVLKSSEVHIKQ